MSQNSFWKLFLKIAFGKLFYENRIQKHSQTIKTR